MNHLKQIAAKLPEYGIDAMLITSESGEFYAVGFHGEGVVLVTPERSWYFTDSRYVEAAGTLVKGAQVSMPERGANYRQTIQVLVQEHGIEKLGFEEGRMTVAAHEGWKKAVSAQFCPAGALLDTLRCTKDGEEIAAMTAAQRIAEGALDEILGFLRPGLTEQEVAARLQYEMLRRGAEKMSFDPIVASGPNSSMPHAVPGARRLERGDFITMDFGCKYGGYCSDMTRTVALGEPTEEMKKVYQIVLEAQLAGIAAARAGIPGKVPDAAARAVIDQAGYGAYFGHSFGHSLGLEIHENPNFSPLGESIMPVGAVVSAEPGIYLPGRFGVRIEDVLVLEETGCTDLTKAPKDLIIL